MAVVSSGSPLTARRRLGGELRMLRDRAGMTVEEVGAHINCHLSKVSRIELGKRTCTREDFDALMDLYEVGERKRAELAELMTRSKQRIPPWWHVYTDVLTAKYAEFLAYEAEATHSCEYQSLFIPAMLQTADYARAVTDRTIAALGPDHVDALVEVRLRRQDRLREEVPLSLDAVITEAALRMQVGGVRAMRAQLRHLMDLTTTLDNVSLRIIPFEAGEKGAATGAFQLFASERESAPDVAFTESVEAATFRDAPLAVRRLSRLFRHLSDAALPEQDSAELIERIEKELAHDG